MIGEIPKQEQVENLSIHFDNNENRGFNIFVQYGLIPAEIQIIRLMFHSSFINNTGKINKLENIDWNSRNIIAREEEWLEGNRNQTTNLINLDRRIILSNSQLLDVNLL